MDKLANVEKVVGIKQTKNAIVSGRALRVYIASDTKDELIAELVGLCEEHKVEVVSNYNRKELAKACKVDVPSAAAAVLK